MDKPAVAIFKPKINHPSGAIPMDTVIGRNPHLRGSSQASRGHIAENSLWNPHVGKAWESVTSTRGATQNCWSQSPQLEGPYRRVGVSSWGNGLPRFGVAPQVAVMDTRASAWPPKRGCWTPVWPLELGWWTFSV